MSKAAKKSATKNPESQILNEIKKELRNLATKDELKKLATKTELKNLSTRGDIEVMEKSLRIDTKLALLNMERRLENKISQSHDHLLTTFDPLLKELEQRQKDRELASDQTARIRSQIDDHEGRIKILEQIQPA